jgi:hypothetical protein
MWGPIYRWAGGADARDIVIDFALIKKERKAAKQQIDRVSHR